METTLLTQTLVICLGGTGQLVAKALKEKLKKAKDIAYELGLIRIFVIDSTSQETGSDWLSAQEFYNMGGFNANRVFDAIRDEGMHPEIGEWLYLGFRPGVISVGAGGIRQIGRLCFFLNRHKIQNLVMQAMRHLMNVNLPQWAIDAGYQILRTNGIEIHIVGSMCGGTGAGCFLDMAYSARYWAEGITNKAQSIAHVVMPEAFQMDVPESLMRNLRANFYAAAMEWDYFTKGEGMSFSLHKDGEAIAYKRQPVDLTYWYDGQTSNHTLNKQQVVATVANMIHASIGTVGKAVRDIAVDWGESVLSQLDQWGKPQANAAGCCVESRFPIHESHHLALTEFQQSALASLVKEAFDENPFGRLVTDLTAELSLAALQSLCPQVDLPSIPPGTRPRDRQRIMDILKSGFREDLATASQNADAALQFRMQSFKGRVPSIAAGWIKDENHAVASVKSGLERLALELESIRAACENASTAPGGGTQGDDELRRACRAELAAKQREFFSSALSLYADLIREVRQLARQYERLENVLKAIKISEAQLPSHKEDGTLRIIDPRALLELFEPQKALIIDAFRTYVIEHIAALTETEGARQVKARLEEITQRHLQGTLTEWKTSGIESFRERLYQKDPEKVLRLIEVMDERAEPIVRFDDACPKNFQAISVIEAQTDSILIESIRLTDPFVFASGRRGDGSLMRRLKLTLGFGIHWFANMRGYKECYEQLKIQSQLHLDKNWNGQIDDLLPIGEHELKALQPFAVAWAYGWMKRVGRTYSANVNGTRDLGKSRHAAFATFSKQQALIDEVEAAIDVHERALGDNSVITTTLSNWLETLSKLRDQMQPPADADQERDIALIQREREAIQRYLNRIRGLK